MTGEVNERGEPSVLFLDDDLGRTLQFSLWLPEAELVSTAQECIDTLAENDGWTVVLLDHDLEGEVFVDSNRDDCGMEVVRWIVDNRPAIDFIVCHSHNQRAAGEMEAALCEASYEVEVHPFFFLSHALKNTKSFFHRFGLLGG